MKFKLLGILAVIMVMVTPLAAQQNEIRFQLPAEASPIAVGETIEGIIGGDNQAIAFSFTGAEDDAISAYVVSETSEAVYLYLLNPDGEMVVFERTNFINLDYKAYIPLYVLEDDGEYQFIVTTSDNGIFGEAEHELDFSITFAEPEYTVLELDAPVTATFEEVADGEEAPNYFVHTYLLEVARTDIPFITLESETRLSLTVEPFTDPTQEALTPNRGEDGNFYLSPMYAERREKFAVSVSGSRYTAEGAEYTLTAANYVPYPIASGETVSVPLSVETLRNYLRFEGVEGDEISISVSAGETTDAAVVVFDPRGRVADFDRDGVGIKGLELLEDGEYTILVYPQAFVFIDPAQLGDVEVTLTID